MSLLVSRATRGRIAVGTTKKALVLAVNGLLYFGESISPLSIIPIYEQVTSGAVGQWVGPLPVEMSKQLRRIRKRKQNQDILIFINAFVQCR